MTLNSPAAPCAAHFTLQGKGGVGKSLVAAIIAQYFKSIGAAPTCIDTDPVNQTLVNYKALNASYLPLMAENSSRVDERKFDDLMEQLLSKDGVFVVDNGSASFIPLSNYLLENDALRVLRDAGCDVYIHVIITGGQALLETLEGFRALAAASSSQNIVVWLNEYFGPIELDGKTFVEMKVYKDHASKVRGTIRIQERNADTFGKDIQVLAKNKLTFEEALASPDWQIMARQRIRTVQRALFEQLDAVRFWARGETWIEPRCAPRSFGGFERLAHPSRLHRDGWVGPGERSRDCSGQRGRREIRSGARDFREGRGHGVHIDRARPTQR